MYTMYLCGAIFMYRPVCVVICTDCQQDVVADLKMELQSLRMEVRKLHSSLQGKTKPTLKPSLKTPREDEGTFVLNAVVNLDYYPAFYPAGTAYSPGCDALITLEYSNSILLPRGYYKMYDNTTHTAKYVYCGLIP